MAWSYREGAIPTRDDIFRLYSSVGWTSYTSDLTRLERAIAASLRVVTAWDGEKLVGLARAVGDGLTIVYLQDILVMPDYQHSGIGRQLVERVFVPYGGVRQKVLITDDEPRQFAFYRAMGFTELSDMHQPLRAFVKFE